MGSKAVSILLFLGVFVFLGAVLPGELAAQNVDGESLLREGLGYFRDGQYERAVSSFRSIIFDTAESSAGAAVKADAYYWTARSYMALEMLDEAERDLEFFLSTYPYHRLYADALYQKGRLLFLQGDPESAVLMFQEFMRRYPEHELVANALYWIGESLYSLGQLEEAARVFEKVVTDYPASFKVTDAGYRLSLIEFKKREEELLKLLKWSHAETLRVTEEFQRREKAYEQAISVYQDRLSAAGQDAQPSGGGDLEALRAENESLRLLISTLETQLADKGGEASEATAVYAELENRRKLLQAKADALAVKEALLQALSQELENRE